MESINWYILSPTLNGGKYYLLASSVTGDSTLIYEFISNSDWVNFTSYTTYNVKDLSTGNKQLYDGSIWLTSIILKSDLFHVHSNELNSESPSLITTNTLEIPVAVDPG